MKQLKWNHKNAQMISALNSFVTWRIYDDKKIRVGDSVEIIDKVEKGSPSTWRIVGVAHVVRVVALRLGDVQPDDPRDSCMTPSDDDPLRWIHDMYGMEATEDTIIQIVSMIMVSDADVFPTTNNLDEAKLYTDGGSRGNPGPSACGFVILTMDDDIVVQKGTYLGITTNNQAEYQALKFGLEELKKMSATHVHVYMDSLLVVNQMQGIFKVKNRDLWPIHDAVMILSKTFKKITFTHVPRELNKLADAAVNRVLDDEISS
jgi:ribonuclease HI